jgi:putative endonuclease
MPYYVYILSSRSRNLYTGLTNNLTRRAAAREKEIKGWLRVRKVALIEERNPTWDDLAAEWFKSERN